MRPAGTPTRSPRREGPPRGRRRRDSHRAGARCDLALGVRRDLPAAHLDGLDTDRAAERWAGMLSRQDHRIVVGEADGSVVGFAVGGAYRPQDDEPTDAVAGLGELYAIYVHPTHQGGGLGAALHDTVMDSLRATGHREAVLWVLEENAPTRAWYARRGWQPDGATVSWGDLVELRLRRAL